MHVSKLKFAIRKSCEIAVLLIVSIRLCVDVSEMFGSQFWSEMLNVHSFKQECIRTGNLSKSV